MKLTDVKNADRLVSMFGDEIVYCPEMKAWYKWDGRVWKLDDHNGILQMAKKVAESWMDDAKKIEFGDSKRTEFVRWSSTSEGIQRLKAMIEIAQSDKRVRYSVDGFDRNPALLNVANGVIDLDDCEFRAFDRRDFITKIAHVTYNKGAHSVAWEKFLADVIPDPDMRVFVQTAVGYSLTASTEQDVMFILHGDGRNGKTTFITTILSVLGGYGAQASSQLLLHKSNSSAPSNEMLVLMGKRFVAATETGEACKLDENLIKQATGGNRVSINPKYRSQMEFTPVWKLWLDTNHEPTVAGSDAAIWSRLIKIPFSVTIPRHKRDPKLRTFLTSNYNERSGILNWMLDGVRVYRDSGLTVPASIQEVSRQYRMSQDFTGQFISEMCHLCHSVSSNKNDLYREYSDYCKLNNESPKGKNAFGHQLMARGISDGRTTTSRYWIGIEISNAVDIFPV